MGWFAMCLPLKRTAIRAAAHQPFCANRTPAGAKAVPGFTLSSIREITHRIRYTIEFIGHNWRNCPRQHGLANSTPGSCRCLEFP